MARGSWWLWLPQVHIEKTERNSIKLNCTHGKHVPSQSSTAKWQSLMYESSIDSKLPNTNQHTIAHSSGQMQQAHSFRQSKTIQPLMKHEKES